MAKDLPQEKQAWGETEDREKSEVRVKPYCPQRRVGSLSEAECFASLIRQANNKRKNSNTEDSQPGKSVRKKKNFKKFKHDIPRIVVDNQPAIVMPWEFCDENIQMVWSLFFWCRHSKNACLHF